MQALKQIRVERGYTEYKMAQLLGITQTSYRYLERKAQGVAFSRLIEIKEALGLSWDKLGKMLEQEFKK